MTLDDLRPDNPHVEDQGPSTDTATPTYSVIGRKLLAGGLWAVAGKILTAGSGILISLLVTRLLPPSGVGAYFLALSVVTFAALAGRFGLEKTALQFVAERLGRGDAARARTIVIQVLVIGTCTVTLLGMVMSLGLGEWIARVFFSSSTLAGVATLLAPWMAYLAFEGLIAEIFRGLDDIPRASIYGGAVSRSLCVLVLTGVLLVSGESTLEEVVLLTIACGILGVLAAGASLEAKLTLRAATVESFDETADLLDAAWPLLLSNLTLYVVGNVDLWILGAFRPEEEVALYGVAVRLVLLVGVSLSIANAVLPPLIGKLHARGDRTRLERVIRTTTSIAALPSLLVLFSFIVAGAPILRFVFGPFYSDAALVLALLGLGQVGNVIVGSCGYVLIMTGHQKQLLWSALASGSVSIIGGLLTVGTFGAEGVAGSMMLGMVTQQILMLSLAKRRVGIWTHASPSYLPGAIRFILREVGVSQWRG